LIVFEKTEKEQKYEAVIRLSTEQISDMWDAKVTERLQMQAKDSR
jgi:hypothetical protein